MRTCIMLTLACGAGLAQRAEFLKLIDRPRVSLAPEVERAPATGGLVQENFSFASEAGERVPGVLIRKGAEGPRPVVVALHGTGGNKESEIHLLRELAAKGFTAVAIDGRHHGARAKTARDVNANAYSDAILRTYRTGEGHPFLYDTVWDILRLVDYLETRSDVDPKRIGLIGFSKGGMETYLAAAVDTRISVAVPCIGVQSFRWALDNDSWQSRVGTLQKAIDGAARDAAMSPSASTEVDAAFVRAF